MSFHRDSFIPDQGDTTPSYNERLSSLITFPLSIPKILPYPPHLSQAPYGLLKENNAGVGSRNLIPSNSNLFENSLLLFLMLIVQYPSPSNNAVSIESVILFLSIFFSM